MKGISVDPFLGVFLAIELHFLFEILGSQHYILQQVMTNLEIFQLNKTCVEYYAIISKIKGCKAGISTMKINGSICVAIRLSTFRKGVCLH